MPIGPLQVPQGTPGVWLMDSAGRWQIASDGKWRMGTSGDKCCCECVPFKIGTDWNAMPDGMLLSFSGHSVSGLYKTVLTGGTLLKNPTLMYGPDTYKPYIGCYVTKSFYYNNVLQYTEQIPAGFWTVENGTETCYIFDLALIAETFLGGLATNSKSVIGTYDATYSELPGISATITDQNPLP